MRIGIATLGYFDGSYDFLMKRNMQAFGYPHSGRPCNTYLGSRQRILRNELIELLPKNRRNIRLVPIVRFVDDISVVVQNDYFERSRADVYTYIHLCIFYTILLWEAKV